MEKKHVVIIGAGPGGLTAAMLLAHRGFKVTICEKDTVVGGRNAPIKLGAYTFDTGPTFLMMNFILEEMFAETGRKASDYLKFTRLDPMYRLKFNDVEIFTRDNLHTKEMQHEINEKFPGNNEGFEKFNKAEKKRFEKVFPCLQKDYSSFSAFFGKEFINSLPYLALNRSLFENLGKYFKDDKLKLSFTFQAKYLGMSPWECPAAFTIIPHIEHEYGIYHVEGGLNKISEAMAKVVEEEGGNIRLASKVKRLIIENKKVKGIELETGEKIMADEVVINEDFAHAMTHTAENKIPKYTDKKLKKKKFSCSTFMIYLGVKKKYDLPHHNVFFSNDYRKYVENIFKDFKLNEDVSFYIQNASPTDATLAPEGKSALYILVPVANNMSGIDWDKIKNEFRNVVMKKIKEKSEFKDLEENIEVEKIITPLDWEREKNVYLGATFNLGHKLTQMLYFRPHNKFETLENCWLTGGGTHPGSGLPTIYESGRISANLMCKKYGIKYITPSSLAEKRDG
ncbi:MAG: phytoene desaturase family protein [bacterium]